MALRDFVGLKVVELEKTNGKKRWRANSGKDKVMGKLKDLKRCPAGRVGRQKCNSPVFYDWGLELLDATGYNSVMGGQMEAFKGHVARNPIKICARCTTPYIIEGNELVDISEELGAEDVKSILLRGQATLPHTKIKDP